MIFLPAILTCLAVILKSICFPSCLAAILKLTYFLELLRKYGCRKNNDKVANVFVYIYLVFQLFNLVQ